jgi:hypothetical protein
MFESQPFQMHSAWPSGLYDHRTRLLEAQETGRGREAEIQSTDSPFHRRMLASVTWLTGRLSSLRGQGHDEKGAASPLPDSLQACC